LLQPSVNDSVEVEFIPKLDLTLGEDKLANDTDIVEAQEPDKEMSMLSVMKEKL